ncbi:hypothetical protein FM036_36410 [Nostoc sp. HG1]|nr:hypothetical protein [Nostoc sp. HG1]
MKQNNRSDFTCRQLENNLIHISESIIQGLKYNKCKLKTYTDYEEIDASIRLSEIDASLEKSFIELGVYFSWPMICI